jgi:hypothetical protein
MPVGIARRLNVDGAGEEAASLMICIGYRSLRSASMQLRQALDLVIGQPQVLLLPCQRLPDPPVTPLKQLQPLPLAAADRASSA